jgi:hypothetical protein
MPPRSLIGAEISQKLTLTGGLNLSREACDAKRGQCFDARDVWVQNGIVKERPGYLGFFTLAAVDYGGGEAFQLWREEPIGTFSDITATGDLSLLAVGSRWYIGDDFPHSTLAVFVLVANTTKTHVYAEYWNGQSWTWLPLTECAFSGSPGECSKVSNHLNSTALTLFIYAQPPDWATCNVGGTTKYYIRFTIFNVAIGAVCTIFGLGSVLDKTPAPIRLASVASFGTSKRYLTEIDYTNDSGPLEVFSNSISPDALDNVVLALPGQHDLALGSLAIVLATGEAFIGLRHRVTVHKARPSAADDLIARVETGAWAIGPGAPYDANSIALDGAFPRASLVSFFKSLLWFADIEGDLTKVQWSAAAPYHHVLPSLAFEYVDAQPSAMAPLGENQIVYTAGSIWAFVFTQVDDFGVSEHTPVQMVKGRGCIAPNSLKTINGAHIFLSSDGIYLFGGTQSVKKITLDAKTASDRLQGLIPDRLNLQMARFAAAAHWETQRTYLLSIPVDGSDHNNLTIAWQYEIDALWLWNISAQFWIEDRTPAGAFDALYFVDNYGVLYKMGVGETDHGADIGSYVVSAPLGLGDSWHKQVTEVKMLAPSHTGSLKLSVWPNGIVSQAKESIINFGDARASKWGTAKWGTAKWTGDYPRFRHQHFRADGSYFHLKVEAVSSHDSPLAISAIDVRTLIKYEDTR